MPSTRVHGIPLSTINAGAIQALVFTAINTGLPEACFFIRVVNDSNTVITISFNGSQDIEYIPAEGVFELGSQTNAQPNAYEALFAKGQIIYVRGVPGVGLISLSGYYV